MIQLDHMAYRASGESEQILWARELEQLEKGTKRAMKICKRYRFYPELFSRK